MEGQVSGQDVLVQVIEQVGPERVLLLIEVFEQLQPEQIQELKSALEQMIQGEGGGEEGMEQDPYAQGQDPYAQGQANMYGSNAGY